MRLAIKILLLYLLVPTFIYAQADLKKLLSTEQQDSNNINIRLNYIDDNEVEINLKNKILYNALRIAKENNLTRKEIEIRNQISIGHNDIDSSLFYLKTAQQLAEKLPYLKRQTNLNLMQLYNKTNQFDKSIIVSLSLLKNLENNKSLAYHTISSSLGQCYYYMGNIDSATHYFLATKINSIYRKDTMSICQSLMNLGVMFDINGVSDSALHYYHEAANFADKINDYYVAAQTRMNLGTFYMERNDMLNSIKEFHKASELFIKTENYYSLAMNYENTALAYLSRKNFESSLMYIKKSEQIINEHDLTDLLPYHYKTLVNFYDAQNNADSTFKYLSKAAFGFLKINRLCDASQYLYSYVSRALNDNERIIDSLNTMGLLDTLDQNCSETTRALNKYAKAEIATILGNYDESLRLLHEILPFFKEGKLTKTELLIHIMLSETYDTMGIHQKAFYHASKALDLKDSVFKMDRQKEINLLELQLTQNEKNNLLLEKDLDNKTIAYQKETIRRKSLSTYVFITLFAAVLVILIMLLYFRSKTIAKNKLLEQQNQEIQHQNSLLINNKRDDENIMSVLAHDLSSPFRSIMGLCRLINDEEELDGNLKEYVGFIEQSAKSGIELSDSLLHAKQYIESSKTESDNINVSNILTRLATANISAAQEKQIRLIEAIEPGLVVNTSEVGFNRVIDNILSNAIKYTPINGTVELKASKNEGGVHIEISDSGPGFTENDLKNAFKPFQKLSAQPTNNESSTGLGLYIVKKLMDQMAGEIEIKSAVGSGATFSITFS